MVHQKDVTDQLVIAFLDRVGEHGMAMHVQILANDAGSKCRREIELMTRIRALEQRLAVHEPPAPVDHVRGGGRCPADSDG